MDNRWSGRIKGYYATERLLPISALRLPFFIFILFYIFLEGAGLCFSHTLTITLTHTHTHIRIYTQTRTHATLSLSLSLSLSHTHTHTQTPISTLYLSLYESVIVSKLITSIPLVGWIKCYSIEVNNKVVRNDLWKPGDPVKPIQFILSGRAKIIRFARSRHLCYSHWPSNWTNEW